MWKSGFKSYVFWNYDEGGNLIGIDYYSPNSLNNPLLENFIIPPGVYFGVSWSTHILGTYAEQSVFIHCIWTLSISSPAASYYLSVYIGQMVVMNSFIAENLDDAITFYNNGSLQFEFGPYSSLGMLTKNILHEAYHGGEFLGLNPDLGNEYIETYGRFDPFKIVRFYNSPQDRWAINFIKQHIGPLYQLGVWWPKWPKRPHGVEGWILLRRESYP